MGVAVVLLSSWLVGSLNQVTYDPSIVSDALSSELNAAGQWVSLTVNSPGLAGVRNFQLFI